MVGLLAVVAAASGCNATRRELTVVFAADATRAQQAAALQACAGAAPHASPEPLPTATTHSRQLLVRFRIDSANDHDIAQLTTCLQRQRGVIGFQDSADAT